MWAQFRRAALGALTLLIVASSAVAGEAKPGRAGDVYGFSFTSIDGEPMPLAAYRGKVVLIVNTASFCGFTHQYEGLQKLWAGRKAKNFVLIGVPSRDFAGQEYKTEKEVKDFCTVEFSIDFPLTTISKVKGADAHPFFAFAAKEHGAPGWNFNKYLVDSKGRIVKRYGSGVAPKAIGADIDRLLGGS